MRYLVILAIAVFITAMLQTSHSCKWEMCPYQGKRTFYPPDDSRHVQRMDSIHFYNPELEDYELEERAQLPYIL